MIAAARSHKTTARPNLADLSEEKNARCAGQSVRVLEPSRLAESVDRRRPVELISARRVSTSTSAA